MSSKNGFVKRFTLNIPKEEWDRIKELTKHKKKNYTDVILEAVNLLYESNQQRGGGTTN